jgi:hypothetical protein
MDKTKYELYENARKRIRQKKVLCYHFVFFLAGSLFMYVANELLEPEPAVVWYTWTTTAWFFILILHFVKVYVTDRFMNKEWENDQVRRLVERQERKIARLKSEVAQDYRRAKADLRERSAQNA